MNNYTRDHDQINAAFEKGMITPQDFAAYTAIRNKEQKIFKAQESGALSNSGLASALENSDQWCWQKTNRGGQVRFELFVTLGKDSVIRKATEDKAIQKSTGVQKQNPSRKLIKATPAQVAAIRKAISSEVNRGFKAIKDMVNGVVDHANSLTKGKKIDRLK